MSVVRRVVVLSRRPQIHGLAREVAQEVFAADDWPEAAEIVSSVGPDLLVCDGTFAPAQMREHLEQIPLGGSGPCTTVAVLAGDDPFSEAEYRQAGVAEVLTGEDSLARLRDIAAALGAARPPTGGDTGERQRLLRG